MFLPLSLKSILKIKIYDKTEGLKFTYKLWHYK